MTVLMRATLVCLLIAACGTSRQAPSAEPSPTEPVPTNPTLAPNAPADKPVHANNASELAEQKRAMAPYIQQARTTYPDAKKRYLAGLPAGHHFFVTVTLRSAGAEESVFLAVHRIKGDKITGTIASDIMVVEGYKNGDRHTASESEIIDWMVAKPDGSEEGNVVGKFLDEWSATHR